MRSIAIRRLPIVAVALILLLPGIAPARADTATGNRDAHAPAAVPSPSSDAKESDPANEVRRSGAQVLPLAPADASTARGQERGNAALRAGRNPSQGAEADENGSSEPKK